ncbi:cation:proton antiporter [Francisellaceae bacterium]|nr:cation:proton antiporter [Francisellaceae bacterium]
MPIFQEALIYLLFAIVIVPLAKRFGLGSVLGYLLAGIIIGPILGLAGDASGIQHVAEFGVVMMLFLIGLELKPIKLWNMRGQLLGLGGLQVLLSILLISIVAWFMNNDWHKSITIGMILALSSTAIVLQTLGEKGLLKLRGGQAAFSVLLFQDIAVIPILAILPILARSQDHHSASKAVVTHHILAPLPGWAHALVILGLFIGLIIVGRLILNPIFKYVARARILEIFTATILLLIISIAVLMKLLGLSPALGTFMAGLLLSESEYRHEIESQVMPVKGLLLGVFFVSIGASINFSLLYENASQIIIWVVLLLSIKFVVLACLAHVFGYKKGDFWLFSLSLTQAGEFAFVLLTFATGVMLLTLNEASVLFVVVALTMLTTPILFILFEKIIMPSINRKSSREDDVIEDKGSAILVGVGRFGQIVARMLNANNYSTVVVDHDSNMVEQFRKYKSKAYYGNALKIEFLVSAGLNEAKLVVAATGNRLTQIKLVELVKKYYPHVKVIARALDRHHVYELEVAGADFIVRELFDSSLEAAKQAMIMMGENPEKAGVKAKLFRRHDEKTLQELKQDWLEHGVDNYYVDKTISKIEELNAIIQAESKSKK